MARGVVDVAQRVPVRKGTWQVVEGRATLTRRRWGPVRTAIAAVLLPWAAAWVRLTLDHMGTVAWESMDGRTTEDVLVAFRAEFPQEGRLDERFAALLQQLVRRGFVAFDDA